MKREFRVLDAGAGRLCRGRGENEVWVRDLSGDGDQREVASRRLYEVLLRAARSEVGRRASRLRLAGPELDDIAHQAAADALLTICGKVETFRGDCKFTTWAYKFVIFDVAAKINRHFWQRAGVRFDDEDWERLPTRLGIGPEAHAESRDLMEALVSMDRPVRGSSASCPRSGCSTASARA